MKIANKQKCNLCGFNLFEEAVRVPDFSSNSNKKYSFFKCKICGLFQQNPIPSPREIESFYPKDYEGNIIEKEIVDKDLTSHIKKFILEFYFKYQVNKKLKQEISIIEKYKSYYKVEKLKILDIGCGAGDFVKKMKNMGHQVYALDIDPEVIEYLKSLNINASLSFFHEYSTKEKFDVIYMSHSLEHVPNVAETLEKAKSLLNNNGMIYIRVPNVDSFCYFIFKKYARLLDLPRHIYMFSPKTITNYLQILGFKNIELGTESVLHFEESLLNFLGCRNILKKHLEKNFLLRIIHSSIALPIATFNRLIFKPFHFLLKDKGEEIRVIAYNK